MNLSVLYFKSQLVFTNCILNKNYSIIINAKIKLIEKTQQLITVESLLNLLNYRFNINT